MQDRGVPSYYARPSARNPAWREAQIARAAERKRRRRQVDPDACRLAHRNTMRRYRERLRAYGRSFGELHEAIGGDPDLLRLVLTDELRLGRVHLAAGRYALNGRLDPDVRLALRDLEL